MSIDLSNLVPDVTALNVVRGDIGRGNLISVLCTPALSSCGESCLGP